MIVLKPGLTGACEQPLVSYNVAKVDHKNVGIHIGTLVRVLMITLVGGSVATSVCCCVTWTGDCWLSSQGEKEDLKLAQRVCSVLEKLNIPSEEVCACGCCPCCLFLHVCATELDRKLTSADGRAWDAAVVDRNGGMEHCTLQCKRAR